MAQVLPTRGDTGTASPEPRGGAASRRPRVARPRPHASFFGDFSDDRLPRGLAILDPSPRHLPEVEVAAVADQDFAAVIQHRRECSVPEGRRAGRRAGVNETRSTRGSLSACSSSPSETGHGAPTGPTNTDPATLPPGPG